TIASSGVTLIERSRSRVGSGSCRTGDHSLIRRGLVTGLARRNRGGYRGMSRSSQRRAVDVGRADVETARADISGGVTAGAVAIEGAGRNVAARQGGDRNVGKSRRHRRAVAAEA